MVAAGLAGSPGHAVMLLLLVTSQHAAGRSSCTQDGPSDTPCVDRVTPNTGSLAGGTLLFLHGTNLLPEAPDPLVPAAQVTVGGVACDIQRVMSSSAKLVCRTGPSAAFDLLDGLVAGTPRWHDRGCDAGRQAVTVSVLGVGGDIMAKWNAGSRYCMRSNANRYCSFTYAWHATPHIWAIEPRAASPGDLVTVRGAICAGDVIDGDTREVTEPALKRFERVLVGSFICELSHRVCDTATTKQCPTMFDANLTSGPCQDAACELPRRYRPKWWFCEDGVFRCRLPPTLPLGRHNVSFTVPSEKGHSVLTAMALTDGVRPAESAAAFEAIPIVRSVEPSGSMHGVVIVRATGVDGASAANAALSVGGLDCPLLPSLRAPGVLACNRTLGQQLWVESTAWPASCLEILTADPDARSGFYRVRPAPSAPVLSVYCDMDTAGGGWTLCGKYDAVAAADGADTSLPLGFGRADVHPEAMGALPLGDGSVQLASLDCRLFLRATAADGAPTEGHVLSIGTDQLGSDGYDTSAQSDAAVRITGPVPAGDAIESLFDVAAPCVNATVTSWNAALEPVPTGEPAAIGLVRDVYAYDSYGPNSSAPAVQQNGYQSSWLEPMGCTNDANCADLWDTPGLPPPHSSEAVTDVMEPMGVFFPNAWRRHRSYAVRLRGWFVPPFTAQYRFVLHGVNNGNSYVYLSRDHTPGRAFPVPVASKRAYWDWYKFIEIQPYRGAPHAREGAFPGPIRPSPFAPAVRDRHRWQC